MLGKWITIRLVEFARCEQVQVSISRYASLGGVAKILDGLWPGACSGEPDFQGV